MTEPFHRENIRRKRDEAAEAAAARVRAAYVLGETHTHPLPLVAARVPLPES